MTKKATSTIRWIETALVVPNGYRAGQKIKLYPWQKKFLRAAIDGDSWLSVCSLGRGNGKTGLLAYLGAAMIAGPLMQENTDSLVCSKDKRAAGSVFTSIVRSLGLKPRQERGFLRCVQSGNDRAILNTETGTSLASVSSGLSALQGENFAWALCDEIAFWRNPEDVLHAITTGRGKQAKARLVAVGTRPAVADGVSNPFNELIDSPPEGVHVQLHSYTGDSPLRLSSALDACPSAKSNDILRAALKDELKEAKRTASSEASWSAYRLNSGSGYSGTDTALQLVSMDDWKDCVERAPDRLPEMTGGYVLGLDPGGSSSWTALAGYWPDTGRLEARCWIPSAPDLEARCRLEHLEIALYRQLIKGQELFVHPGRVVHLETLLEWAKANFGNPARIVTDRYKLDEVETARDAVFKAVPVVTRGTGFRDADVDTRAFQAACLDGKAMAPRSALWRHGIGEAILATDSSGAQKMDKARKTRAHYDQFSAGILAVSSGIREPLKKRAAWNYVLSPVSHV